MGFQFWYVTNFLSSTFCDIFIKLAYSVQEITTKKDLPQGWAFSENQLNISDQKRKKEIFTPDTAQQSIFAQKPLK